MRSKIGLFGIAIGSFGLIISLFLFYALPTPSLINTEKISTNAIIYFTSIPTGGLAICLGILAFVNAENHRETYISLAIGIVTIALPFIKFYSLALLGSLLVSGILVNIISRKEL